MSIPIKSKNSNQYSFKEEIRDDTSEIKEPENNCRKKSKKKSRNNKQSSEDLVHIAETSHSNNQTTLSNDNDTSSTFNKSNSTITKSLNEKNPKKEKKKSKKTKPTTSNDVSPSQNQDDSTSSSKKLGENDEDNQTDHFNSILPLNSPLYKNIDDFEEIELIESGSYGEVKKYKNQKTSKFFAFKFQNIDKDDKMSIDSLKREIILLTSFKDPTILSLYGIIEEFQKNRIIFIFPFFENQDLVKITNLDKMKKAPIKWDFTQKFIVMYGIANGMNIIHKNSFIQIDLKPSNILITDDFEPIIADFDLYEKANDSNQIVFQETNDDGKIYDKSSDVYSFAMLCYQLFTNIEPFGDVETIDQLKSKLKNKERPEFPENFNSHLKEFIEKCWNDNSKKRPSFKKIIKTIGKKDFCDAVGCVDFERLSEYIEKVYAPEFDFYEFKINQDLLKDINDFEKIGPIGHGKSGTVFKYKNKNTGEFVAIKKLDYNYKKTIWIQSVFHHPAIQKIYGLIDDNEDNEYSIISRFEENGELDKMLELEKENESPKEWDLTQKYIVAYGIASGMKYLHDHNIIHCNLNTTIILLNEQFEPIISDFQQSKPIDPDNPLIQSNYNISSDTFAYENEEPDIFKSDVKFADVFAFSMILYQLFTGSRPFGNRFTMKQILQLFKAKKRPQFPQKFRKSLCNIFNSCWNENPEKFPTFDKILEDLCDPSLINEIDFERLVKYQKRTVPSKYQTINVLQKILNANQEDENAPEFNADNYTIDQNLFKNKDEFKELEKIGEGSFEHVYKCQNKKTGELVTIQRTDRNIKRLICILSAFHHPAIQKIYGLIDVNEDNEYSIISRFEENGDLDKMLELEKKNETPKEWDLTQKYIVAYGIASGMKYLHDHNIIHCNLNTKIILLNEQFEPIISDFQQSKPIDPDNPLIQSDSMINPAFSAPEILLNDQDTYKYDGKLSDVYSFSMILYQIFTGNRPYGKKGTFLIIKELKQNNRPQLPSDFNKSLKYLIESCWENDPQKRMTFNKIIEYFNSQEFITNNNHIIDFSKLRLYQWKIKTYMLHISDSVSVVDIEKLFSKFNKS